MNCTSGSACKQAHAELSRNIIFSLDNGDGAGVVNSVFVKWFAVGDMLTW